MFNKVKKGLFASASLLLLAACGDSQAAGDGKEVVTLWSSGSDNVRETMEKLADAFNESEYAGEYELEVQHILSGSGAQSLSDRVIAAYEAGEENTDYDLILMSDAEYESYVQRADEGFFKGIDFDQVPNSNNLLSEVSAGKDYLVPYRGTTVVLAYNSEAVPTPPKTAEELYQWIKDNPGRFAYNSPGSGGAGSSFVTTAIYNQLPEEALTSSDESWKDEWDAGFALLEELHPYMYQSGGQVIYPNKNQGTLDLLANNEVDMIPAWADQSIQQIGNGTLPATTKIAQINPSFTGNVDALSMPSIGSNEEGAHAVMDFFLSEEAQSILLDEMAAIPLIDSTNLESANSALLEGLDVSAFRVSSLGTLGSEINERWDQEIATLD